MPSENKQPEAELKQPWKQWHADLNSGSRQDVVDGTLVLHNNGNDNSGTHGTVALQQKHVDLSTFKEKPVIKVGYKLSHGTLQDKTLVEFRVLIHVSKQNPEA